MSQVALGVVLALLAACTHAAKEESREPAAPSAALTAARDLARQGCACATLECADAALTDLTSTLAAPPAAGESSGLLTATRELLACRERLAHRSEPADMDGALSPAPGDAASGVGAGSGSSPD